MPNGGIEMNPTREISANRIAPIQTIDKIRKPYGSVTCVLNDLSTVES